jgi:hypothetical protein
VLAVVSYIIYHITQNDYSRFRWSCVLRRASTTARLLGSRVWIQLKAWIFVSCVCWVFCRQRRLWRADHSFLGVYRVCVCLSVCLIVCDQETSRIRRTNTDLGPCATEKETWVLFLKLRLTAQILWRYCAVTHRLLIMSLMGKLAHWPLYPTPPPPTPTSRRLPAFQRKFVLLFEPAMVTCFCSHYCYLLLVPSSAVTCALSPTPHSNSSPIWWASCIYGEVWFWEQVGQYYYRILIQCQIPVHSICTGNVCISVRFHKLTAIYWTG